MEKLQAAIRKFYSHVEIHESKVEEIVKKARKPCSSLVNQSLLLRAVLPNSSLYGTDFTKFPNFRNLLISEITGALEKELVSLQEIREELKLANDELFSKYQSLESTYEEVRKKNLFDASVINPCSPSFERILSWSLDVWRFYHSFYLQVSQSVQTLNFEDEISTNSVQNSFNEDKELKKKINKIRSFGLNSFKFLDF